MAHMHAYPGRTMGQLYHRFFRVNDLADGTLDFDDGEGEIELADVRVPVMAVAGSRPTCSRRARRCTTSARCSRTPPRSASRPRPAGISACSPAAAPPRTTWAWIDEFFADTAARPAAGAPLRVVA